MWPAPGPLVTVSARGSPGVVGSGQLIAGEAVERVEVAVGEPDPHVGDPQHLREYAGQRGFLLADPTAPAAGPAVAGLPPDELRCRAFRESSKPVLGLQRGPQQRRRVLHHKPCRLHGVLGAEVVVVTHLAGQIDELLHRSCAAPAMAMS
jgi:hypothetical protein